MLTRFDLTVIIGMSFAIIGMSFVFPALGMGGTTQDRADIPNMSIDTQIFDFDLQMPDYPGAPGSGVINHSSSKFDDYRGFIQTELGGGASGNDVWIVAINETHVQLVNGTLLTVQEFTQNGSTHLLTGDGFEVEVHSVDISNGSGEYEWQVMERPADTGFLESIPLVGGLFSAGEALASIVGWIGATILYGISSIALTALNMLAVVVQVFTYFLSVGMWLVTTYTGLVDAAPAAWVKVLMSIPGIALGYELAKLAAFGIRTVPFT